MSDVRNLRCDLGQLLRVCEKAVETTALDFNGAVAEEVTKVITIGPRLEEPDERGKGHCIVRIWSYWTTVGGVNRKTGSGTR